MKPGPFAYHRPASLAEALDMLGSLDGAKILAGGQSLVAMLNMRYAFVEHVIDINRVSGLDSIEIGDHALRIGAMARQRDVLESKELLSSAPIIGGALRFVGHLHTRNRGTIGGSMAHMDPAAELMNVATLLDATVHVESKRGKRDIEITDYPVSFMTPSIEPDEIISAVKLRPPRPGHGWSFQEFAQRHGDFAIVAVGATVALDSQDKATDVRLVLSGVDFAPRRIAAAEQMLQGAAINDDAFAAAAELAAQGEIMSDAMVSGDYRRRLAKVLTKRALAEAFARARGGSLQ